MASARGLFDADRDACRQRNVLPSECPIQATLSASRSGHKLRGFRFGTSISPDLVSLRPCWRLILADKGKELQPKAVIEADYKRKRHEEEIRTGERSGIELI